MDLLSSNGAVIMPLSHPLNLSEQLASFAVTDPKRPRPFYVNFVKPSGCSGDNLITLKTGFIMRFDLFTGIVNIIILCT